jgi:membrane protease YdiL (CAAX protease family)
VALAVIVSGLLFGAAHGLIVGLPILAFFGIVLGWLRVRTDSVLPGMMLHAAFNGIALIAAVSGA